MRKLAITSIVVVMLILSFGTIGCGRSDGAPEPRDVVPMSVPGFALVEAIEQNKYTFGKEHWPIECAYTRFEPKDDAIYWGKVQVLTVAVNRFKDEATCKEALDYYTAWGEWRQIWVNGDAKLTPLADCDEQLVVVQQRGKLLIISNCLIPTGLADPDREVQEQAAIEGLKAIGP